MPIESVRPDPEIPRQQNFEIERRDLTEEAAKASKQRRAEVIEEEGDTREQKQVEHNETRRQENLQAKETERRESDIRKDQETENRNRNDQDDNPDSGNIINVVA